MAKLLDCVPVDSLEVIDDRLVFPQPVTIEPVYIDGAGGVRWPGIEGVWEDPGNPYILGLQYQYEPLDGSHGVVTVNANVGEESWVTDQTLAPGKTYRIRYRAIGAGENAFGEWSDWSNVTMGTQFVSNDTANVGGTPASQVLFDINNLLVDVEGLIETYGDTASAAASAAAAEADADAAQAARILAQSAASDSAASSGLASGYASTAQTARNEASGFATAASGSAVVASAGASAARGVAVALLPERYTAGVTPFTYTVTGSPTYAIDTYPLPSNATDASFGLVYDYSLGAASSYDFATGGLVPATAGKRWRAEVELQRRTGAGGTFYLQLRYLDANYDQTGAATISGILHPMTGAVQVVSASWGDTAYENAPAYPAGTVWVRPYCRLDTTGTGAMTVRMRRLTIREITGEVAAGNFASAAQSSAAAASASSAAAQASAVLAATVSVSSLVRNARFTDTTSFPSTGLPTGWDAGQGGVASSLAAGESGGFGFRRTVNAGQNAWFSQGSDHGSLKGGDWIVIFGRARLNAGTLTGAGIYFQAMNSSNGTVEITTMSFVEKYGFGVAGQTYSMSKLVKVVSTAISRGYIYGEEHDPFFGSVAGPIDLTWYELGFRPATAGEIETGEARGSSPSLLAKITDVAGVAASAVSAVATRTSTLEARVEIFPNLLPNPSGRLGTKGWLTPWFYTTEWAWGSYFANSQTNFPAPTSLYSPTEAIYVASGYVYTLWGKGYVNGLTAGGVRLSVYAYDNGTNYAGEVGLAHRYLTGRNDPNLFTPIAFTVPSGKYWIRVWAILEGVQGPSVEVAFYQLKLELGDKPTVYSEEGVTQAVGARVTIAEGAISTLAGRNAAWIQQEVNAGSGAAAFVRLYAETSPGVQTSDVSIGAREIHLFNQVGNSFIKALSIIGGNAIFSGGITVGTYIRMGSGEGWPIAYGNKDFLYSDGETKVWNVTFDNIPSYTYVASNLAPLAAGESYSISLNATKTQGTAAIKILTPAAPSNYTNIAAAYAGGTSAPDYTVGVTSASRAEAIGGDYDLEIYTSWQTSYYSTQSGDLDLQYQEPLYGNVYVDVFAMKSGVWVLISTEVFGHYIQPSGYVNHGWNPMSTGGSEVRTINLGTGVQAIGVQMNSFDASSGPYDGGSGSLTDASWQAPGASSGTRSATPNGEKVRFTIMPR